MTEKIDWAKVDPLLIATSCSQRHIQSVIEDAKRDIAALTTTAEAHAEAHKICLAQRDELAVALRSLVYEAEDVAFLRNIGTMDKRIGEAIAVLAKIESTSNRRTTTGEHMNNARTPGPGDFGMAELAHRDRDDEAEAHRQSQERDYIIQCLGVRLARDIYHRDGRDHVQEAIAQDDSVAAELALLIRDGIEPDGETCIDNRTDFERIGRIVFHAVIREVRGSGEFRNRWRIGG